MTVALSLSIGASALQAAQISLDTTSNNIANANTPGYSRETTGLMAMAPTFGGPQTSTGALPVPGDGVGVANILRVHSDMLDSQYRSSQALSQGDTATATAMQQIEAALNEPSSNGIQAGLSNFFNGFSALAAQPESSAARTATIQQGVTLASTFNTIAANLTNQRASLDQGVVSDVSQINADAQQVAGLNLQLSDAQAIGQSANQLQDQRDELLDQLAGLAGTTSVKQADGSVTVSIGAQTLVSGTTANQLETVADPTNSNLSKVEFTATSTAVTFSSGEVSALLDARDNKVQGALSVLDNVANTLMTAVNTAHKAGFGLDGTTNEPFFTGSGAAGIAVNTDLVNNPQHLATAAAANEPGDATVATAIAGIQNQQLMNGGTATIGTYYAAQVGAIGSASAQAQQLQSNQSAVTAQIDSARQSISGVSIDEETTNLMQEQRAYQAAAQIIAVTDSMLNTLVNISLS